MIKLGLSIDDNTPEPAATTGTKTGDSDMPPLEEDKPAATTTGAAGDSKMEEVD